MSASAVESSFLCLAKLFQSKDTFAEIERAVEYRIEGAEGGVWTALVSNGAVTIIPGSAEDPDCIVSATVQDWLDLVKGEAELFGGFQVRLASARANPGNIDEELAVLDQIWELQHLGLLGRTGLYPPKDGK